MRVPSGFLVAGLYLVYSHPRRASLAIGLIVAFAGLSLRAWATGHLAKNQALATTGPYAYTRNPLYLGTLTVATGFAVAGRSPWLAILFLAYFLAVYLPVISEEEDHLRKLFPNYAAYAANVPRFLPRLSAGCNELGRFQWTLYKSNREYQALLGYLAAAAVLAAKVL